ncbi:MFS general substrate transporter [Athelia psychrophila]|uniref:MFS general substrate transporter n=1 Tax=Athelia psychrophila TaxID=1759441 RepID=A0A166BEM5_9AGAM|nr:MFS general substrate transporter [Fibularhizoctonia sp. CBS 109695]
MSALSPRGNSSQEYEELMQEDLLPELGSHPLHTSEHVAAHAQAEREAKAKLPWWKRPSMFWISLVLPFTAISSGATLAPRVEIYRNLACSVHRPEYSQLSTPLSFTPSYSTNLSLSLNDVPNNTDDYTLLTFDDERRSRCAADPEVSAATATLTLAMVAAEGALSCITTGWWGSFSDRRGRTRVLGYSVIGLLTTGFMFIFVSHTWHVLPGGYWLIVFGPIVEGFLGGQSTSVSIMQAYVSDITDAGARAAAFSLFLGILFVGMALGPTLGGIMISLTGDPLIVFYVAFCLHSCYAIIVWFFMPESLSKAEMESSLIKNKKETDALKNAQAGTAAGFTSIMKRGLSVFSPLALLLPVRVEGKKYLDWNLTLVALVYGSILSILGLYPYSFIYATTKFNWSSTNIGIFLSIVLVARATYLMVILPIVIKLFKPKPTAAELSEGTPLLATPGSAKDDVKKEVHNPQFELQISRASLAIEVFGYVFMAIAPTGITYTLAALVGAVGQGFVPSIQSIALELYNRRGLHETGKLLGALAVVSALCSQVIGPAFFGFMYVRTVAFAPGAVFYAAAVITIVAFAMLCSVRLGHGKAKRDAESTSAN